MKDTWNEEPEKRPLFTDIVKLLHKQNIEDTLLESPDSVTVEDSDSGYLDIFS